MSSWRAKAGSTACEHLIFMQKQNPSIFTSWRGEGTFEFLDVERKQHVETLWHMRLISENRKKMLMWDSVVFSAWVEMHSNHCRTGRPHGAITQNCVLDWKGGAINEISLSVLSPGAAWCSEPIRAPQANPWPFSSQYDYHYLAEN